MHHWTCNLNWIRIITISYKSISKVPPLFSHHHQFASHPEPRQSLNLYFHSCDFLFPLSPLALVEATLDSKSNTFQQDALAMVVSETYVHPFDNNIFLVFWTFGCFLLYLQKFPICIHPLPTSRIIMVIQTTKRTCNPFLMLYKIKRNVLRTRFIPAFFTFISFKRR